MRNIYANVVDLGFMDDLPNEPYEPYIREKIKLVRSLAINSSRPSANTARTFVFSRILKPVKIEVPDDLMS